MTNEDKFKQIFGLKLADYQENSYFNVIKFMHDIEQPSNVRAEDWIRLKYGDRGVKLILRLCGG